MTPSSSSKEMKKILQTSIHNHGLFSSYRRRRYFYLATVTLTVTKTDILRGPRSLKTKHDKQ